MLRIASATLLTLLCWMVVAGAQQAPPADPVAQLTDPTRDPGPKFRAAGDLSYPGVLDFPGTWPWKEKFYGKEYPAQLKIKNECKITTTVGIFVNNLPYISPPSTVSIPGKSEKVVPLTIKTPPPPNPIILPGGPKMDPNAFTNIDGSLVVWHPWRGKCLPKRIEYTVSGHIHFEPPKPPPSDPDAKLPEKIAGADPCQVWWNTGQQPPQVKSEEECVGRIQQLASEYRSRVLESHAQRDPAGWQWLPTVEALQGMSIGQLLAMRDRAAAQINGSGR